jgi:hypothetical protein
MTGIEAGISVEIGHVDGPAGSAAAPAAGRRESRYTPNVLHIASQANVPSTQAIVMVSVVRPAPGKIWSIRAFNGINDDTASGFFGSFGVTTQWHLFIGDPAANPSLANNNLLSFTTFPIGQLAGDYIGSATTGQFIAGGTFISSKAVWCRYNQTVYALVNPDHANAAVSNFMLNVFYDEYDEEDILPDVSGGKHGVRKNRTVNILPQA